MPEIQAEVRFTNDYIAPASGYVSLDSVAVPLPRGGSAFYGMDGNVVHMDDLYSTQISVAETDRYGSATRYIIQKPEPIDIQYHLDDIKGFKFIYQGKEIFFTPEKIFNTLIENDTPDWY